MSNDRHDYEPDYGTPPSPMNTDSPCRTCGQSRGECERQADRRSRRLEDHRFSFEGACSLLVRHLTEDHDVPIKTVSPWAKGLDQGSWIALDDLHTEAHMSNELREAAQRVTGYVRAWQLLSNTDSECLGDVTIMPPGAKEPVTFKLLAADLEELAVAASRCTSRVPDVTGVATSRTCGLTLDESGACPRPREEHV